MSILSCCLIQLLSLAPCGEPLSGGPVLVSLAPEGSWVPVGRSALARGFCWLPRGFLPGIECGASLWSRSGVRYPTTVHTTAAYADGSARALRIVAELPVKLLRGAARLELVPGPAPRPSHALSVQREGGRIRVNTGALRLTLAEDGPDLLPELTVRGCSLRDPRRPVRIQLEADGQNYSSQFDPARRVAVAGHDPLACRLRLSGQLVRTDGAAGLDYSLSLAFLAGSPLVEIDVHVRSLGELGPADHLEFEFPLEPGSGARAEILGTGSTMALKGGGVRVEALHGQSVSAQGPGGSTPLDAGNRNGLLLSGSSSASVALAVSRLRPNAPRAVTAEAPGTLAVLLHDGPFLLDEQFALRCELVLGAFPRHQRRELLPALLKEPVPSLRGGPASEPVAPGISRLLSVGAEPVGAVHTRLLSVVEQGLLAEVGYRDFGDYRYQDGFANLEYDPSAAFLLAYLDEGDPARLILARDQLNHWVTFDRSRGERGVPLGFPWMHGPDHRSLAHEMGHLWAGGAVLGWLILGDPELSGAVQDLRRALIEISADPAEFREERTFGWSLLALEDLLLLGADPGLEAGARRLVRQLIESQDERGYFRLDQAPERTGAAWAPTPWVTAGISIEALYRQYLRTRESDLVEAIGRATDFLMRDARGEDGSFAQQVYYGGQLAHRMARAGRANPVDLLLIAAGLGRASLLGARPGVQTLFQETLLRASTDLRSYRLNVHQAARALVGARSLANTQEVWGG